ncbi:MAG: hypothetical protein ACHQ52_11915 [Candidatus Eisenbacteria bacterium]
MERTEAEQIATRQLDSGERLLWSGSPTPGSMALGALPLALFGIPFSAFAAFWIVTAWTGTRHLSHSAGPWFLFPLFGLPFLFVGLGVLTAPIWAYFGAAKTVYAVTDRRALIIVGWPRSAVQSFQPADIGDLVRVEGADGRGSLMFGSRAWTGNNGMVRTTRIGFVGIPDVRMVEELIRENLQKKAA